MTKKEIQANLKELGYDVTLRARKSTLLALLEQAQMKLARGDSLNDPTSPVTFLDDIHDYAMENDSDYHAMMMAEMEKNAVKPTTEEWMEFTKVDKAESSSVIVTGLILFLLGALVVFLWEDGVSFMEMAGLAGMIAVIAIPIWSTRE